MKLSLNQSCESKSFERVAKDFDPIFELTVKEVQGLNIARKSRRVVNSRTSSC